MDIRPFCGAAADSSELKQRYGLYVSDRRSAFPGFPLQTYEQYRLVAATQARGCTTLVADAIRVGGPGSLWAGQIGFRTSLVHPTWTVDRVRRIEAEIAAEGDEVRCAEIGMLEATTAELEAKLSIPGTRRPIERSPLLQRLADIEA